MTPTAAVPRRPSTAALVVRVVVVTFAFGVLGFALGGLLGIIVLGTMQATGVPENMHAAFSGFAVPGGIVGALAGLAAMLYSEKRERQKARP